MNEYHGLGNLTRDPELKSVGSGDKRVVNFGIAVNRRYKKGKESVNEVVFLDCEAWDTGADLINRLFKKGNAIIVHGSLKQDTWKDKNTGETRSKIKLRVQKFDFVPGSKRDKQEGQADNADTAPAEAASGQPNEEEVPF